ncbi:MAG: NAD(P)-dependent alcohol dehydrogenase [Myxococcales bacterium]|nr:NAD(P)-dependent alcohol dehydrogenase [Myxococcales bacterium]
MQALRYASYGPPSVLRIDAVAEPRPGRAQARVEVRAAALNPKDVLERKGKLRWAGARGLPRVPGYDFAGVMLDALGDLPAGARVFGMRNGMGGGACAQVLCADADEVAPCPADLDFAAAASLPLAGQTALQALRDLLKVRPGDAVLINGASGGVGTLAVQIAAALGATVTGVCSTRNLKLIEDLGASTALDYTAGDVLAGPARYDALFDCFGSMPWARAKAALKSGGRFCTALPKPTALIHEALARVDLHRGRLVVVRSRRADLDQLAAWVADGRLRPAVDRILPWTEAAEAHTYVETRRARGKVVLTIGD